MKIIPLTRGFSAKVDDEDFARFGSFKWTALVQRKGKCVYAVRAVGGKHQRLHRAIMDVTDPEVLVDHENHDGLDCQRRNLRVCTRVENNRHRRGAQSNSKSGVRGVMWNNLRKRWVVNIEVGRKQVRVGSFISFEAARSASDRATKKHFGAFAGNV